MSKMLNHIAPHLNLRRIAKFGIIGVSNTAISYAVFWLVLYVLGIAFFAQILGYAAGIVWSFFWNRRWTFADFDSGKSKFKRFLTLQIFLWFLSSLAIGVLVDILGLQPTIVWVCVMAGITLLNYFGTSIYVFDAKSGAVGSE